MTPDGLCAYLCAKAGGTECELYHFGQQVIKQPLKLSVLQSLQEAKRNAKAVYLTVILQVEQVASGLKLKTAIH